MLRKTLFVLAIASALAACGKESKDPGKGGKDGKEQAGASANLLVSPEDLLTIQSNALASGPVITGSVQPERNADLRAEVSAVVIQVMKENGEVVKRGDVLVRLDETSIRDSLNSAEEASRAASQVLEQSERMFQRMKTLRASGMTSTQALEDAEIRRNNAQSDLSAAKSRAAQARQQLQRTLVRAPFEGRGLITRAAGEFTRLAFEHVGLNRVVIRAGVENGRSRAVPQRLGYVEESVERGGGRGLGGFYDIVVYSLLAQEWRDRPG